MADTYVLSNLGLMLPRQYSEFALSSTVEASARQIPSETLDCLRRIASEVGTVGPSHRTQELLDIAILYEGGEEVFSDRFFPKPDGMDTITWRQLKARLLVLVNLLKASVRRIRAAVYGGGAQRVVGENHPYRDELEKFFGGWYATDMRRWFNNRALLSNAPAVAQIKISKSGKRRLRTWLPDPIYTYMIPDPEDSREYLCIAEVAPDGSGCQFVTRQACGKLQRGYEPVVVDNADDARGLKSYIQITDFGFLPATVAHAEERRQRSCAYTAPGGRDAAKPTIRASDILFNGSMLQKLQTKGVLGVSGVIEQMGTVDFAEMMSKGIVFLDKEGKLQWAIPESRISDTIEILDKQIDMVSVTMGVPVDDLNPSSSKGTSAEEAKRRQAPLTSLSDEYSEVAELDEEDFATRSSALIHWAEHGEPVDLDDFRDECDVQVSLAQSVIPGNDLTDAQASVMLYDSGIKAGETVARQYNPRATQKQIDERVKEMQSLREKKNSAPKPAPGAAPKTLEEK